MENPFNAEAIAEIAAGIVIKHIIGIWSGGIYVEQDIKNSDRKNARDSRNYHRTQMQREMVIRKLKEEGCRITKQRLTLLDIILKEECSCCKEIYYKATKIDEKIGAATVYRMINMLESIGAISRKNMYKIACSKGCEIEDVCTVELDDNTVYHLSAKKWSAVIKAGLKAFGYINKQEVRTVTVKQCEYV